MKHYIILLFFLSLCNPIFSQMGNLDKKAESKRNDYLMKISKEVILSFGPDYYRDYKDPVISELIVFPETFKNDPVLKDKEFFGRKYYTVTYQYDQSVETLLYGFAAKVDIWADDGQPKEVRFGSGYGHNFYVVSYKDWLKKGIKENDIIPYVETKKGKINPGDVIKTVNDTVIIMLD